MTSLAIAVVGYNRSRSLARLLASLTRVEFDGHRIPLIISLDHSGNDNAAKVARDFVWPHGEKILRTFPQRLGLKEHVLNCGDLTRDFEHLVVLEDDLYVSPNLYRYATQAVAFYQAEDRIAGIALYGHLWNVGCHRPFAPIDDPFDVYLMQYACSWGQIWSRHQWTAFRDWYRQRGDDWHPDRAIPAYVAKWSSRSWLKHHIRYCIETDRFFVYPRISLCTNFSDAGQHSVGDENGYQVPLQQSYSKQYRFPVIGESRAVYDAYFESLRAHEAVGVESRDLCVDLYGLKRNQQCAKYWLTSEPAEYQVLKSFDLALRPHESNVIHGVPGELIKLYDTSIRTGVKARPRRHLEDALVKYDVRNVSYKSLLRYALRSFARRARAKVAGNG